MLQIRPPDDLPDVEQWSQSSGSNVISRRARPVLAGLRPHSLHVQTIGIWGHSPVQDDLSDSNIVTSTKPRHKGARLQVTRGASHHPPNPRRVQPWDGMAEPNQQMSAPFHPRTLLL